MRKIKKKVKMINRKARRLQHKSKKRFKVVRRVLTSFDRLFRKRVRALRLPHYRPHGRVRYVAAARSMRYYGPRGRTLTRRGAGVSRARLLRSGRVATAVRAARVYLLASSPGVRCRRVRGRNLIVSPVQRRIQYFPNQKYRVNSSRVSQKLYSSLFSLPRHRKLARRLRVLYFRGRRRGLSAVRRGTFTRLRARLHRVAINVHSLSSARRVARRRRKTLCSPVSPS